MRVTNQLFFQNLKDNGGATKSNLYQAYGQLSSGQKIQYSHENSSIYVDTMRLDYELTTFNQIKETTSKAQTFANNTDKAMKQFNSLLTTFKSKLILAANETNSTTSTQALANDLEAIAKNLKYVANTSINGQFIFAGTNLQQKPISQDNNYLGNNENIQTVAGAGISMPYNIPGQDLFQGRDQDYNKIIKTNLKLSNQIDTEQKSYISSQNTIKELVGDYSNDTVFYLQGRKTNGETFARRFNLSPASKASDLLERIGKEYGNTTNNKLVDITINKSGQIVLKDLTKGSGTLEFHLVAATNKVEGEGVVGSKVDNLSMLDSNPNIKITNFIHSNYKDLSGNAIKPAHYDKVQFQKDGNQLEGTISQVVKKNNLYATSKNKLSEVAGKGLDGKIFKLMGKNRDGADYVVNINFNTSGSTFAVGTTVYDIKDKNGNATPADEVTYQQLNDIISMATSNIFPNTDTDADYQIAIENSRNVVEVTMNNQGRINILDRANSQSKITTSLYDNTYSFGAFQDDGTDGSVLSFSANNAIVEDQPYINIFKDLEAIIKAVREGRHEADGDANDPRNPGIQAAIKKIDHIADHFVKRHTKIGSLSNALKYSNERANLLSLNVKTIQSEIIDADYGESMLKMNQLSMSYQAMMQAISKINSLSLVNYM